MGGRATLLAVLAALGSLLLFAGRSPDAVDADPPRHARQIVAVAEAARGADASLDRLEQLLTTAVDEARAGAALILAGDAAPEDRFDAAAGTLEDGSGSVVEARAALARLERAGSPLSPPIDAPELPVGEADVLRIAAELRAAGTTAGAIAALRHAAADVLDDLEGALAAATEGDPAAIEEAVAAAHAGLPAVERWNETLPTLPVWTSAVNALLDSLAGVAVAQRSGDEARLVDALAGYRAAAAAAERADRGLAIALGDAAASIGSGAPVALAEALAQLKACRASVASVMLTDPREGDP